MHWPARVKAIDYQEIVAGKETDLEFVASALRPVFEEFTEVSDVPLSALYVQLAQRYPSAKFYALRRAASSWVTSVRKHIGAREFDPFEKVIYWHFFKQCPSSLSELRDLDLMRFHEWHYKQISECFKSAPSFLELQLTDKGIGRRLCEFCGLSPIPLRIVDYALGHDMTADPDKINAVVCD